MEVFRDGDKENCNTISSFGKAGSRNEPTQEPCSQGFLGTRLTREEACVYEESDTGERTMLVRVRGSPLFSRVPAIVFQS